MNMLLNCIALAAASTEADARCRLERTVAELKKQGWTAFAEHSERTKDMNGEPVSWEIRQVMGKLVPAETEGENE